MGHPYKELSAETVNARVDRLQKDVNELKTEQEEVVEETSDLPSKQDIQRLKAPEVLARFMGWLLRQVVLFAAIYTIVLWGLYWFHIEMPERTLIALVIAAAAMTVVESTWRRKTRGN